jgi:hypothetical protein
MKRRSVLGAVATGGAAAAYTLVARPRQLGWGATERERVAPLAGDHLIVSPDLSATRAITVRARADEVWPWIAQLGQGRGGFYSYDFLENIIGADIHSADRIVAEWQDVGVGDEVRLAAEVPLAVAVVERGRALVLRGGIPVGTGAPPYDFTWAFALVESDETTRLLVRERYAYTRSWARLLIEPTEAISFVMTRRMLRGIKDRAEGTATRPRDRGRSTEVRVGR